MSATVDHALWLTAACVAGLILLMLAVLADVLWFEPRRTREQDAPPAGTRPACRPVSWPGTRQKQCLRCGVAWGIDSPQLPPCPRPEDQATT